MSPDIHKQLHKPIFRNSEFEMTARVLHVSSTVRKFLYVAEKKNALQLLDFWHAKTVFDYYNTNISLDDIAVEADLSRREAGIIILTGMHMLHQYLPEYVQQLYPVESVLRLKDDGVDPEKAKELGKIRDGYFDLFTLVQQVKAGPLTQIVLAGVRSGAIDSLSNLERELLFRYISSDISLERMAEEYPDMTRKQLNARMVSSLSKLWEAFPNTLKERYPKESLSLRRPVTQEGREKMRQSRLGKKASQATRDKLRETHIGISHNDETKNKIGNSLKGRLSPFEGHKHSQETKEQMSEKRKGKKRSEDTKRKISATQQRRFEEQRNRQEIVVIDLKKIKG